MNSPLSMSTVPNPGEGEGDGTRPGTPAAPGSDKPREPGAPNPGQGDGDA